MSDEASLIDGSFEMSPPPAERGQKMLPLARRSRQCCSGRSEAEPR
jgi:hypothetical protein